MAPRILVVTPTYNERDNLPRFVRSVLEVVPEAHVLVVDDASPDGTGDVADTLAADPRVAVLHRPGKLGLGTAYVDGFRHAIDRGYEVVVEMDADLSHDPKYLPTFLQAIANDHADVVLGSRSVPGGGVVGWGPGRHVLSKGGSFYARTILGVPIRDLTTGFKAFTRRALLAIDIETLRSNGYSFQIETTYRALRKGLRVVEVPIVFVDRRAGHSKMSRSIFAEAVVEVWRLRFDAMTGKL